MNEMSWQNIDSGPKDGKDILLCDKTGKIWVGRWQLLYSKTGPEEHWGYSVWAGSEYIKNEPVLWYPIPPLPKV